MENKSVYCSTYLYPRQSKYLGRRSDLQFYIINIKSHEIFLYFYIARVTHKLNVNFKVKKIYLVYIYMSTKIQELKVEGLNCYIRDQIITNQNLRVILFFSCKFRVSLITFSFSCFMFLLCWKQETILCLITILFPIS